ncbi:class I SAM-dependent methyltransferase [Pseudenhygromyxa sp. WMMC2535]|uniref:class I SAM-dependent methyltransferase n=1 Tax=Pseudenhygromyxa sp. WMMC2535 TaxID=2712867 RepID=UPI001551FC54|nr:class I SAM-dependent methyltransferase [Pseudenhygromyxa sp. WMMC2535]NVB42899.1 class I SAM-dependent methyltransferase [Pseudenhygromyxa sp. WMMC2535]
MTYPAHLYVALHSGNPGDVDFYRQRCAGAASVLELGCGDARVLAALAEPDRELVGVDLDDGLLALARARLQALPPAQAERAELVRADMGAELELGRRFDRVIIPFGGLYCLLEPAAVDVLLANVARHLGPQGRLILDVWAADGFHAEAEPEDLDPGWLEHVGAVEVDEGEEESVRYEILERSSWDKAQQRLDVTYLHVPVGGEEAIEGELPQRYLLSEQLGEALSRAGLELESLLGDFEGAAYDEASKLMIVVARRAGEGDS